MVTMKLYSDVPSYYQDLLQELESAEHSITAAYYSIYAGKWGDALGEVLIRKAQAGVSVRLMVDSVAIYLEQIQNVWPTTRLLKRLAEGGVDLLYFNPIGPRLSPLKRLHCKFCDIDNRVAFVGGSNIGDHYAGWLDQNLRLEGDLGHGFDRLYSYLEGIENGQHDAADVPDLNINEFPLHLSIPGHHYEVRDKLLELIRSSERELYIRSWYFLPDGEILAALQEQAARGVMVNIMFSDKTLVPIVDLLNRPLSRQLAESGALVLRYSDTYHHNKSFWNDSGSVLLGSANIDPWALKVNFECLIEIEDRKLADDLTRSFWKDSTACQSPAGTYDYPLPVPG